MKNKIILGVIAILLILASYALGRAIKTKEDLAQKANTNIANSDKIPAMDISKKEEVAPNRYAPTVNLEATKDPDGGYNLHILTNNFYFTPAAVGKDVVQNTGYAEIYVNNILQGRGYGEWFYVSEANLQNATNTISVTLNANNHNIWWSKNASKEARATLDLVK